MIIASLNDRYADALLRVAFRRGKVEEYAEDLETVSEAVNNDPLLAKFFNNPRIKPEIKEAVVDELLENNVFEQFFVNFLKIVVLNGRINALQGILKDYLLAARNYYKILTITIETPVDLLKEEVEAIKKKCSEQFNVGRVRESIILNTTLIGGIKIIAGNTVIDRSIKKQLKDIEKLMEEQTANE